MFWGKGLGRFWGSLGKQFTDIWRQEFAVERQKYFFKAALDQHDAHLASWDEKKLLLGLLQRKLLGHNGSTGVNRKPVAKFQNLQH